MSGALGWLAAHGSGFALGVTVVLAACALAVGLSRAPIHRQMLAELGVGAALCWLAVAAVPLPRFGDGESVTAPAAPAAAPRARWSAAEPIARPPDPVGTPHLPVDLPVGPVRSATAPLLGAGAVDAEPRPGAWPERLAAAYLIGTALGAGWLLLGALGLRRLLLQGVPPAPWLAAIVRVLSRESALPAVRVLVTPRARSPFCCGWRRPTIVLPAALCRPDLEPVLRHVLQHELAHLRQRDGRGRFTFALALPLLWAHPLFWWLRARAHFAAELVADDLAARCSDRHSYARALIELSQRCTRDRPVVFGAASVLRSRSEFFRRMTMLLQRDAVLSTDCSRLRRRASGAAAVLLVAVTASLWGVPRLAAQEPQQDETARELRAERDKLRDEVKMLHAKLRALKAEAALAGTRDYVVRKGDTIDQIAERELGGVDQVDRIRLLNPDLIDPKRMRPGQVLQLPVGGADPDGDAPAPAKVDLFDARRNPLLTDPTDAGVKSGDRQDPVLASHDGGSVLDLITTQIELEGELQLANSALQRTAKLAAAALVPKDDVETAEIRLQTTQRKHAAVQRILAAEAKATKVELEELTSRIAGGVRPPAELRSRIVRLEARLEMLNAAR